ncbi:MAG: hypothetical protein R3C26_20635 [Calditrichia bacterium]
MNNNISGNWASINDGTGITYIAEYFNWFHDRLPGAYQSPSNVQLKSTDLLAMKAGSPGQVYTINPRDTLDLVELSSPPVISVHIVRWYAPSDNVTVKASIVDNGNVQEARLFYSINDAPYQSLRMNAVADTFAGAIPGTVRTVRLFAIFISSVDNVGDRSTLPGDTSRTNGQVYMYTVRQNGLSIRDLGYPRISGRCFPIQRLRSNRSRRGNDRILRTFWVTIISRKPPICGPAFG